MKCNWSKTVYLKANTLISKAKKYLHVFYVISPGFKPTLQKLKLYAGGA